MPSRHFFVGGQYLGSAPAHARIVHETVSQPLGYGFCCQYCGEQWAICPVEGRKFMHWTRCCPKHGPEECDPDTIPGSLYMPWEPEFIKGMPHAVVQRELVLHLAWAASRLDEPIASAARSLYDALLK